MKAHPNKRKGVLHGTRPDVKQYVKVVFTKVMVKSLTIQATTQPDRWRMYQLVWLVVERIDHASHLTKVISKVINQ